MAEFEDFFVSPLLKSRLLASRKSDETIGFSGMHEHPLKDLLALNSQEIIASEHLHFLAKREHGKQKNIGAPCPQCNDPITWPKRMTLQ